MHDSRHSRRPLLLMLALATVVLGSLTGPAFAQQASLTLNNCAAELCNDTNTAWELTKTLDGVIGNSASFTVNSPW